MSSVTLNYVWINAVRQRRGIWPYVRAADCPIPERYLEQVSNVRAENPEIDINIWFDVFKRGYPKGRLSQEFGVAAGLEGVCYRQLREIPSYQSNPLFKYSAYMDRQSFEGSIWRQVDLARLLVVQHQMRTVGGTQIYADLDIISPIPSTLQNINKYGFTVATYVDGAADSSTRFRCIENQHFAFDAEHPKAHSLMNRLVYDTIQAYQPPLSRSNGWIPFVEAVCDFKVKAYPDVPVSDLMIVSKSLASDHPSYPGYAPK